MMKTVRSIREFRGLKFPDEFLTRFFFKYGHDRRTGRVVELGCGNGNNLAGLCRVDDP